jgi:hypothetical protein
VIPNPSRERQRAVCPRGLRLASQTSPRSAIGVALDSRELGVHAHAFLRTLHGVRAIRSARARSMASRFIRSIARRRYSAREG